MRTAWIVDIGNSRTKLAEFYEGQCVRLIFDEEAQHLAESIWSSNQTPDGVLLAASGEMSAFWEQWRSAWEDNAPHKSGQLIELNSAHSFPIEVDYGSRHSVGLDRLANAAAAHSIDPKNPWLIIDIGTCITADLLEDGAFKGGSISPGIELRLRSMYAGTAHLPLPENWRQRSEAGVSLHVGNDTESSLLAGAVGGVHAELTGRISAFSEKFKNIKVALTGGDAKYLQLHDQFPIFADPNLTVTGYYQILKHLVQNHHDS